MRLRSSSPPLTKDATHHSRAAAAAQEGKQAEPSKQGGTGFWDDRDGAGGGIKGGVTYGATTPDGAGIAADKVGPPDLNATIGYALGLPLD